MENVHFSPITEKVIVLDLDECLLHTFTKNKPRKVDFVISFNGEEKYYVKKRNKLDKFLDFCFMYFNYVIVWSAGTYDYVHEVVDNIFEDFDRPDLVLTRDDIVYEEEGDYYKPLSVVAEKLNIDMRDIFFLDDKKDNFRKNPGNGFTIKKFKGKKDNELMKFRNWLLQDHIKYNIDVRKLNKKEPWYTEFDNKRKLKFPSEL